MKSSILEYLYETSSIYPDKVVYRDNDSSITFKDLREKVDSIGTAIVKVLIESGKANADSGDISPVPIAVMTGRHVLTPACFLGVNRAGHFYAPIEPELPDQRLAQILDVASPQFIITDRENLERTEAAVSEYKNETGNDINILLMEELLQEKADDSFLEAGKRNMTGMSPMYMIFTSGSTGKPKGVLTSHYSLLCYLDGLNDVIGLDETDVLGNQSPLDYIAAVRDMYLPLFTGCETVIIPRSTTAMPDQLFGILNDNQVTTLCWSASGLEVLAKLGAFESESIEPPKHVKRIVFSGSVMAPKYLRMWQDGLPETLFINQYGPTETTASCTYYVIQEKVEEKDTVPIGKPFKNYKVFLLPSEETEDGIGEICVAGPALALGYYRAEEQTNKVFIRNPKTPEYYERIYLTGDLGKYNADGELLFLGRKDRQIKHMGHRIELDEIEHQALKIQGVTQAAAAYNKDKETLYLFYTGDATPKDIVLYFRANMPSYMVPRKNIQLEEMPKLPNGKLDRSKLIME